MHREGPVHREGLCIVKALCIAKAPCISAHVKALTGRVTVGADSASGASGPDCGHLFRR
jgi:hypothetical protein